MRDALASLPVPARLLTALLLLLGALVAPHAANLSPLLLAFFYTAILWRLIALRRPEVMPRRWLLLLLTLTAVVLVVATTNLADGRSAGTALLVVMLGLKLLELRARRDLLVTVFLGYFLVLTHFLYDQSLVLAGYLFTGVAALMSVQVGANRVGIEPRLQLRNTLAMLAGALPLALVVFLLFPRLHTPLWGISGAGSDTALLAWTGVVADRWSTLDGRATRHRRAGLYGEPSVCHRLRGHRRADREPLVVRAGPGDRRTPQRTTEQRLCAGQRAADQSTPDLSRGLRPRLSRARLERARAAHGAAAAAARLTQGAGTGRRVAREQRSGPA